MSIEKGQSYSWPELLKQINGEKSEPVYALHRRGQLLGLALNRWQNPHAPDEVLVGQGQNWERYADDFIRIKPILPIFIRENEKDHEWYCVGCFQIYGHTDEIVEKNKRLIPGIVPAIYKILFLEEVCD
jgi:hypothetical protein